MDAPRQFQTNGGFHICQLAWNNGLSNEKPHKSIGVASGKVANDIMGLPPPSARGLPGLIGFFRRTLQLLIPSFLMSNSHQQDQHKQRPTDFLDGMRGYAAYIVAVYHYSTEAYLNMEIGYGGNNGVNDYWITQLPFIRLFISGRFCVHVFFVISGFSISLKSLKLVRSGSYSGLAEAMASAIFRRAGRLYLPCLPILVITMILGHVGAGNFVFRGGFPRALYNVPPRFDSFMEQVWHLITEVFKWADPFREKKYFIRYSTQLWTIPWEFRSSLVSLLVVLGLAKVRSTMRIIIIAVMAIYCHMLARTAAALFLEGTILAELHLIRQDWISQTGNLEPETKRQKAWNIGFFVLGLYFASYPSKEGGKAMYWSVYNYIAIDLFKLKEPAPYELVTSIGAVLLVWVVSRSPTLQRPFTTRLAKYLGNISFALYLVHATILVWFGYANMNFFWWITGKDTTFTYALGHILTIVSQTVILVWVADIYWRFVDVPSVKLMRRLEEKYTCA
ncbi:acyltransferase family-domain-containing protein [Dendryphion nanum]|uniref:Acyltransferase family-domain-containing protein n=1 Tax=Dendryphion nanum TaxID=256645 RepID=A0A9P9EII0_9PLEO|nr:acyltransferase family-domain-containing protein [Dendryphion nanum]